MPRLLMLFAIVVVIYLLIRSFRKNSPPRQDGPGAEDMVRCAHCGVHIPKGESVQHEGRFFCGSAHRDAFKS